MAKQRREGTSRPDLRALQELSSLGKKGDVDRHTAAIRVGVWGGAFLLCVCWLTRPLSPPLFKK